MRPPEPRNLTRSTIVERGPELPGPAALSMRQAATTTAEPGPARVARLLQPTIVEPGPGRTALLLERPIVDRTADDQGWPEYGPFSQREPERRPRSKTRSVVAILLVAFTIGVAIAVIALVGDGSGDTPIAAQGGGDGARVIAGSPAGPNLPDRLDQPGPLRVERSARAPIGARPAGVEDPRSKTARSQPDGSGPAAIGDGGRAGVGPEASKSPTTTLRRSVTSDSPSSVEDRASTANSSRRTGSASTAVATDRRATSRPTTTARSAVRPTAARVTTGKSPISPTTTIPRPTNTVRPTTTRPATTRPATTRLTTTRLTTRPTTARPTTTTSTVGGASGRVIWEDHFESLDTSTWRLEHSSYGDGNNELQCYRPENVSVANGKLILSAVTETYTCPGGSVRRVTSGMVRSRGVEFSPGQAIEFRVKLTPADPDDQSGLWPAVWASGWAGSWPRGGEMDWLEVMTAENPKRAMFSMHYADPSGAHRLQNRGVIGTDDFSAAWHVVRFDYGRNGRLAWYLDGVQAFSVDSAATLQGYPAPFDETVGEIKINLALGGRPGPLAAGAVGAAGATFEMDYIRILEL